MKRSNRKGFAKNELIIVIAAIAVLALVLIPSLLIIGGKNNDLADMQDKTNKQLADLAEKLEDAKAGLTADEVEKLLNDALANLESPDAGLTEDQVQAIIDAAIAGIKIPSGLTSSQVKKIVADALKGINTGMSKEELEQLKAPPVQTYEQASGAEREIDYPRFDDFDDRVL